MMMRGDRGTRGAGKANQRKKEARMNGKQNTTGRYQRGRPVRPPPLERASPARKPVRDSKSTGAEEKKLDRVNERGELDTKSREGAHKPSTRKHDGRRQQSRPAQPRHCPVSRCSQMTHRAVQRRTHEN